ncbi:MULTISPECIES: DUF2155 domain-containing protein [Rhodopseudomonas]|uniref:Signal peptide protein n=1 Tax=Rhodopseudomonas palustris TaxID=1076 RepID=A0A0D7EHZ0_RHOPL|nr:MULTISPECIES: DUF2155 domain-containing protein [Rhodopseudomonas]KIZ40261.1 signal peptide protein [Rhodopseudomonas palustris]MDF3811299.1 DUF2155 domain-containing protein [Rhodopseudomonas sp. BAL398]WOK18625.1 DUF2155 domain-containing protein [Rhodopseudomonas sp. BAL398]
MSRIVTSTALAALLAASLVAVAPPARAQIGNIFSDPAPRPPGSVPRDEYPPDDEEEVPDLPQRGRLLPAPNRLAPGQGAPLPGAVQSQPLPPPPGTTIIPQNPPASAAVNPLPGLPPGQRQPKGQPQPATPGAATPDAAPPTAATLQPGDEIVTEPPAQKIVNKKASFSGLDKITGRIINFDADIGETVQFGALRVKTDACYTRPATEAANTDAFVEVDEITLQGEVKRIFSGWMFAASPGLHGVEHPIYDIWLTDCKNPENAVAAAQPDTPAPAPAPKPRPRQRSAAPPNPFPAFRQ